MLKFLAKWHPAGVLLIGLASVFIVSKGHAETDDKACHSVDASHFIKVAEDNGFTPYEFKSDCVSLTDLSVLSEDFYNHFQDTHFTLSDSAMRIKDKVFPYQAPISINDVEKVGTITLGEEYSLYSFTVLSPGQQKKRLYFSNRLIAEQKKDEIAARYK